MQFNLNEKESEDYIEFQQRHAACNSTDKAGAIGGAVSVEFSMTGLGQTVMAKCAICNLDQNITDFSDW